MIVVPVLQPVSYHAGRIQLGEALVVTCANAPLSAVVWRRKFDGVAKFIDCAECSTRIIVSRVRNGQSVVGNRLTSILVLVLASRARTIGTTVESQVPTAENREGACVKML